MRTLLALMVIALGGCSGPSEDNTETAADGVQESIDTSLNKAEGVEDILQDAADDRDAALEEADSEN